MALTPEQKEMAHEYRRIDIRDDDLVGLLVCALETREQQQQMVDYMKSQENLTYEGVIEEVIRITGPEELDDEPTESEDYISPETEFSSL